MRADPEREVRVRVAVDAQLVGRVEHVLVAVGRLVEHEHLVAGLEVDAAVGVVGGDGAARRRAPVTRSG